MNRPDAKTEQLPQTDSIQELARFWDEHDLTDFEGQLEEVPEPVFARPSVRVPLQPAEMEAVRKLAEARGVGEGDLVRQWVLERLQAT